MPAPTPPPTLDESSRILIVRLGAVGDVVRTLPAVRMLREHCPTARLAWAVERASVSLLKGHPDIDEIHLFDRRWPSVPGYVRSLRRFAPTHSFDFQSSLKAGLIARLSGARTRFGFARGVDRESAHIFATHRVDLPEPRIHRVERACALSRAAGASGPAPMADLHLGRDELEKGRTLLKDLRIGDCVVSLACFSSRRQAYKRYPLAKWGQIAAGLAHEGLGVLILGGPGEQEEMERIKGMVPPEDATRVATCPPANIRELAALIAASDQLIGGDTGPMHLGWATGRPVVALYGPTDPVLNAPFGDGHVVIATDRITGRQDDDRFAGITPDRVLQEARQQRAQRTGVRR